MLKFHPHCFYVSQAEQQVTSAIEAREQSQKENSTKLSEAGERITALAKSENSLKQQLGSKDRVLLQMNAELFAFRNKANPSAINNDMLKEMQGSEGEMKELRAQVAQLSEDNKRIDHLELRLASANRGKAHAEEQFKKLSDSVSKFSIQIGLVSLNCQNFCQCFPLKFKPFCIRPNE